MGTIETIFENYKASYSEETPLSEGQDVVLSELEKATLINSASGQTAFDKAIALFRESEKAGFILGFRMVVSPSANVLCSCERMC